MTLNPDESRTLDAALARIVPAAPRAASHDPGGLVARDFVLGRAAVQPDVYRAGLALLAACGFAELGPEGQDAALGEMEGHPFFGLLVQHALEGYYTSETGFAAVGFRVTA